MNAKSLTVAVFLFVFVLFFAYGRTEGSGIVVDAITPKSESKDESAVVQLWPIGAILLGLIYANQQLYNPRSIVLILLAGMALLCFYALTDSREAFKGLMSLVFAAIVVYNSAGAVDLNYAVPFIFGLAALAYLLFFFELKAYADLLVSAVLVSSIILLAKPKRFADSLAVLLGSVLFVT